MTIADDERERGHQAAFELTAQRDAFYYFAACPRATQAAAAFGSARMLDQQPVR
jgi:hypothetical protein